MQFGIICPVCSHPFNKSVNNKSYTNPITLKALHNVSVIIGHDSISPNLQQKEGKFVSNFQAKCPNCETELFGDLTISKLGLSTKVNTPLNPKSKINKGKTRQNEFENTQNGLFDTPDAVYFPDKSSNWELVNDVQSTKNIATALISTKIISGAMLNGIRQLLSETLESFLNDTRENKLPEELKVFGKINDTFKSISTLLLKQEKDIKFRNEYVKSLESEIEEFKLQVELLTSKLSNKDDKFIDAIKKDFMKISSKTIATTLCGSAFGAVALGVNQLIGGYTATDFFLAIAEYSELLTNIQEPIEDTAEQVIKSAKREP